MLPLFYQVILIHLTLVQLKITSKKVGTFNIKIYNLLGENVDSYS